MDKVVVGGTFDYLHKGHQKMLSEAMGIGDSLVGVTSDELASKNRSREVSPFEERKEKVEEFCSELSEKTGNSFEISKIESPDGENTGVFEEDVGYIIISPEEKTVKRANEINDKRHEMGLKPLKINIVEPVYSEDGKRISSTRISKNIIDRQGNLVGDSIGVSIVNDIHYGFFEDEDANEMILKSLERVLKNDPSECTIILGDLIHEQSPTEDEEAFRKVWEVIKSNTREVYFTPGNHDVINLSKEFIEDVVGHPIPTKFEFNGENFILLDSATASEVDNVGRLSEESFQLLEDIPNESHILSHFLLEYTDGYRKSKFFDEYPEGVFACNKYLYNPDYQKIKRQIFAHLHDGHSYTKEDVKCEVLPPFLNITDPKEKEGEVTENIKFY